MQYITQCLAYSRRHHNDALSKTTTFIQIVKEQPISFIAEGTRISAHAGSWSLVTAVKLVEPIGIEPMTSCLQSRRSPS